MKFTLTQTVAQNSSRRSARGFASALVIFTLACGGLARAQEASAPPAPQTPAANATPKPARPGVQHAPVVAPAAHGVRPVAAVAPQAGAQASAQTPKAAPAIVPMPPRQVVTVVHRLSGWKLLAFLATRDPSSLEIEELPSPSDVHTNIVAGYISDDGRTVVAHLPRTESDLDAFPEPTANLFAMTPPPPQAAQKAQPEYMLITADGRSVEAKFVGLDAATGLTLLEASSSLMSNAPVGIEGDTEDPSVGQRVRFYLPALAPPAARSPAATPPVPGYIYVNIDEKEGRLTEVKSWPSGRPFRLVARTPAASDDWTGAVAANEIGEVLGIVSQTGSGESQIVSVATVRGALERVKRLRGSAPQPWIGIGGGAAFKEPLEEWRKFGWTPEAALPHIQNGSGIFLTKVAPGAPAALAGLKPGDIISRIGARDVRGVEDLSLTLKEAGVGSSLDFTVWRALEPEPLKFTVRLAAAHDLGLAFEEAEARAATAAAADVNPAVAPAAERALEMAKSLKTFGLDGLRLTPRSAARLGARGGLLVVAVRPGSSAADCGLRAGDVIETANGVEFTLQEFRRMLSNRAAEPLSLGVVRGGARTNVNLKPSEGSEP